MSYVNAGKCKACAFSPTSAPWMLFYCTDCKAPTHNRLCCLGPCMQIPYGTFTESCGFKPHIYLSRAQRREEFGLINKKQLQVVSGLILHRSPYKQTKYFLIFETGSNSLEFAISKRDDITQLMLAHWMIRCSGFEQIQRSNLESAQSTSICTALKHVQKASQSVLQNQRKTNWTLQSRTILVYFHSLKCLSSKCVFVHWSSWLEFRLVDWKLVERKQGWGLGWGQELGVTKVGKCGQSQPAEK